MNRRFRNALTVCALVSAAVFGSTAVTAAAASDTAFATVPAPADTAWNVDEDPAPADTAWSLPDTIDTLTSTVTDMTVLLRDTAW